MLIFLSQSKVLKKSPIDDLSKEIQKQMTQYSAEIDDAMQNEIDKLSKEIVNELKDDADIPEKTGKYKKSFYAKKIRSRQGI